MIELLEQLLKVKIVEVEVGTKKSAWLTPSGKLIDITKEHVADAAIRLGKLTGKKYPLNTDTYLQFMELFKFIRWREGSRTDELNISVGGKINSTQLRVIGEWVKDLPPDLFYYFVINPETGKRLEGQGFKGFVSAVSRIGLKELIVNEFINRVVNGEDVNTIVEKV